jgi:glutathione-independent formaldehyde dehydrogenase
LLCGGAVMLAEAPDVYRHFDAREDGWTKVVLKPAA